MEISDYSVNVRICKCALYGIDGLRILLFVNPGALVTGMEIVEAFCLRSERGVHCMGLRRIRLHGYLSISTIKDLFRG